jgi:putative transposase
MGEEVLNRPPKNQQIAKTRQETIMRHEMMVCKTYELKVDRSHLSANTLSLLKLLFLEAKWFYNHLIASGDVWHADYKTTTVQAMDRQRHSEPRRLKVLSSQMRQELVDRAKDNIIGLAALKKRGRRVGALKFKRRITSIPLKQCGITYEIKGNRVRVQKIGCLKVSGLHQVSDDAELANATLEQRNGDYYLHVTTYQAQSETLSPKLAVGIDGGVKNQITLSNRLTIKEQVPITRRAVRLHRQLSRRKEHGRNWRKTQRRLDKEYERIARMRSEIRHKIVALITSTYRNVAIQDDNVQGWLRLWGRRVASSTVGGIMRDLRSRSQTPILVDRYEATTQTCFNCQSTNPIGLVDRVYGCRACGLVVDRDLNAAVNMWLHVPTGHREPTPADTKTATKMMTYLNRIPYVSASLAEEAGSHPTFSRW